MSRSLPGHVAVCLLLSTIPASAQDVTSSSAGVRPVGVDGRTLNLDLETGTLDDWTAEGEAFQGQPIEGDTVQARRGDMRSRHQGRFWIGTFERAGDGPRGTLTSAPFVVDRPFASFLVAGGSHDSTRVELLRPEDGSIVFQTTGDDTEDLKRVAVDLGKYVGSHLVIRLVDDHSGGWGHINFDDFRLHDERPQVPARNVLGKADVYAHAGLSPEQSAAAMTVPEGFQVTLAAGEPDIVRPIAMSIDERGRIWVAENHAYPFKVAPEEARDRILIFEDTDGDGRLDSRKLFVEGLNMVTGLEVGFGGVWVGAAPELLFIPDANHDDTPDGPAVTLLDGWGLEDTHETLNSFMWGPDGWLYGTHGVFTHSRVGKPGTPDEQRVPINAGVWRYHPTRHEFEVFAHGTSNPWGLDFNDRGQCFIEACVIPHFFHIFQGGRFQRQAGQHFNPYTYADIQHHGDHVHYLGDNPHRGNDRSDAAGGGHAHSGLMVYLGGAWPKEYRDTIFMNNIHGARLNRDIAEPSGSGYIGRHAPDFLLANDRASQILDFRYGPDGNVWIIDWYDLQQCHRPDADVHDKTKGRIYKVTYGDAQPIRVDLRAAGDLDLGRHVLQAMALLTGHAPHAWWSRQATRLLQERAHERGVDGRVRALLSRAAFEGIADGESAGTTTPAVPVRLDEPARLRALWATHAIGGLNEAEIEQGLVSDSPYLRAWTIQLANERRDPSSKTLATMAEMAKSDPSPVVRLYLASALQRLEPGRRWAILEGLLSHDEDNADHNLPLMDWYAAEPLAAVDAARALTLAERSRIRILLPFMVRRVAAIGGAETLAMVVDVLARAETSEARRAILGALNEALQGRRAVEMPAGWPQVARRMLNDEDDAVRSQAIVLGTTFGDKAAIDALRGILVDLGAPLSRRQEALAALLKARPDGLAADLRTIAGRADALRGAAIRGLAAFDDEGTAGALINEYSGLATAERRDALNTLAARPSSARALLDAVEAGRIPPTDLSADLIRNLRNLKDEALNARITEVWGQARETSADKARVIEQYRALIRRGYQEAPDVALGRAVYARTCGQCHKLFGTGGEIGPDLTGSNRADLDYVLTNVLDPSALVGKDYQATILATVDGRVLTGIVKSEDADAITLVTANETVIVPREDVEERQLTELSLMPEDQWANLSDLEIRSLVAYLASPQQVPMLATAENAATLFNGQDLTGWRGDESLWTVESGEIVGRTSGLDHNEFLASELLAGDFRLAVEVKLVNNEGNSGIQFRSTRREDGEVAGYQADIGPGWWGKLYEEHGRGLLWDQSGEAHVKPGGDWNLYEIEAVGPSITTRINGQTCVKLDDSAGAKRGIFALQLHSGGPTEVRFRNIRLEPIEAGTATAVRAAAVDATR